MFELVTQCEMSFCVTYNSRIPNLDKHFHYVCLVFLLAFLKFFSLYTSVIRLKNESQNGCNKKTKHAKIFPKIEHFLSPNTHKYLFSFYLHFEICSFALLPTKSVYLCSSLMKKWAFPSVWFVCLGRHL